MKTNSKTSVRSGNENRQAVRIPVNYPTPIPLINPSIHQSINPPAPPLAPRVTLAVTFHVSRTTLPVPINPSTPHSAFRTPHFLRNSHGFWQLTFAGQRAIVPQ